MSRIEKKIRLCLLTASRCARRLGIAGAPATIIAKGLCLSLLVLAVGCAHRQAAVVDNAALLSYPSRSSPEAAASLSTTEKQPGAPHPRRANFELEPKSRDAQHVADWVVDSGDNSGMPFAIVDKRDAKVFVFNTDGRLRGAAPALLGIAKGDDSSPGIGDRKMSEMGPEERTTPAGRFVAALGRNFHGKDVLWVDYDLAVSMHRVVTSNPKERRLQRLGTPTPNDNRISFGCINVPVNFFNNVVSPAFTGTYGIVYVLPEIRSKSEIFASYYEVDLRWGAGKTADLAEGARVSRQQ